MSDNNTTPTNNTPTNTTGNGNTQAPRERVTIPSNVFQVRGSKEPIVDKPTPPQKGKK